MPTPARSQRRQSRGLHWFVIRIRQQQNVSLSRIGNAEQMPLNVDMPTSTTVEQKGTCTVHVHTTGAEKQWCTVMLALRRRTGRSYHHTSSSNGRRSSKKSPPSPHVHVQGQEKGWMSAGKELPAATRLSHSLIMVLW